MNSEAQVALIVGIVSAVAALVGAFGATLVGWFLNRKTEEQQVKRAAFVELLSAMDACQIRLIGASLVMAAGDKAERRQESDAMLAILGRVDTARSVAALTLPRRHHEILDIAVNACIGGYSNVIKNQPGNSIHDAWEAVLNLAHQELEVENSSFTRFMDWITGRAGSATRR